MHTANISCTRQIRFGDEPRANEMGSNFEYPASGGVDDGFDHCCAELSTAGNTQRRVLLAISGLNGLLYSIPYQEASV